MMSKWDHRFLAIALVIMVIGGFVLIANWIDETYKVAIDGKYVNVPIYNIKSDILDTDKTEYNVGERILVHWDMCKGTNDIANISVQLENHAITPLVPVIGTKSIGCYKTLDTIVPEIPINLPSGQYRASIDVSYYINELSTIHYRFKTKFFTIKNDKLGKIEDQVEKNREQIEINTDQINN